MQQKRYICRIMLGEFLSITKIHEEGSIANSPLRSMRLVLDRNDTDLPGSVGLD